MNKHTPGPWKALYTERFGTYQIHSAGKEARHWIANTKCDSCPANHEANARLLAAAPELLEALEGCVAVLEAVQRLMEKDAAAVGMIPGGPILDAARAAIAKAKCAA